MNSSFMQLLFVDRLLMLLGASPYDSLMVADVGDMNLNMFDLPMAVKQIKEQAGKLIENGCKPLTMGGDHTITYPLLQAMKVI